MKKEIEILGSGKYSAGEHQQFVDRKGNLVRAIKGSSKPIPIGEAYAFFGCSASKQEIEREIPSIRSLVQTPNELELYVMSGPDVISGNVELRQIAHEARNAGLNYIVKSNYPNSTNIRTADELASILNQAYQSPIFKEREEFRGAVVYKDQGRYVFRE